MSSTSCITRCSPIIARISCTQQKRVSARHLDQAEFFNAIGALPPQQRFWPHSNANLPSPPLPWMTAKRREQFNE